MQYRRHSQYHLYKLKLEIKGKKTNIKALRFVIQ